MSTWWTCHCLQSEKPHGLHACNRGEELFKVDASLLYKSASDQPSLVLDDIVGLVALQLEHPLKGDRTMAERQSNELPGLVPVDGVDFFLHR